MTSSAPSPHAKLLDEIKALHKRRAAAPAARLLEILRTEAAGDSKAARDLRREVYSALSWIETDEVRAVLLEALASENAALAESIGYVLWRQEALMAELPRRIDEAVAAGETTLAGRLLGALVSGDDRGSHRAWVFSKHGALFREAGLSYD